MRSLLITLVLSLCLVSSALASEVRLSIALGMRDAFNEIAAAYEKKQPDVTLLINYAAAGVLANQIVQGAPADIFVSANHHWMNYLVAKQCVPAEQIHIFAYNSLVFVGRENASVTTLSDVARLERIALGSPTSVPVGEYAKQALQAAGLYEKVRNKLVLAKDVRQALLYADRGEADGAFVYRTDALLAKTAVILLEVPQYLYDKVTFVIAPTTSGLSSPQALAFFDFLQTGQTKEILKKYGYIIP